MKRTSLIRALLAALTVTAISQVEAQTVFFSDTFNRPDNFDLDAATNGMSGLLMNSGVLQVSNIWNEPSDAAFTNADSQVTQNWLKMGGNGHSVEVFLNKNFANVYSNGVVTVSLLLTNAAPGGTPALQRYLGFGMAFSLSEGNSSADRNLTRVADLFVAETQDGRVRVNDESPSLRPASGDVAPTATLDLNPSAASYINGVLSVTMTITNTAAGSTVPYTISFASASGTTNFAARSFQLSDNNQFYVGCEERSGTAVTNGNFTISAASYTPPPVTALAWRATTDNNWDTSTTNWVDSGSGLTSYAFFNGANVTFNDSAASGSVNVGAMVLPGSITVNNSGLNYTFSGTGPIGGATGLIKSGNGTLTLNFNNTFTGGSSLGGGRVRISDTKALGSGLLNMGGGTISSIGGAALAITNAMTVSSASGFGDATDNGTLTFSSVLDLSGAIRTMTVNPASTAIFTGGVTNGNIGSKQGSGTLIVRGGLAEVTGSCDAQDGTLMLDGVTVHSTDRVIADAGGGNGIGRLVITNGASVTVSNSVGNLRSGRVASTGSNYVDLAGLYYLPNADAADGKITLEGDAAYSELTLWPGGDVTARSVTNNNGVGNTVFKFNGGILRARNDNPNFFEGLAHAYVQPGGALIDDGGFAVTINQGLETDGVGGGLTKLGAGTLILAGNNTYTGNTIVSNGTLVVTTSGFTGGGNITVKDGAGLGVTNSGGSLSIPVLTLGTAGATTLKFYLPNGNGGPAISASSVSANGPVTVNIAGFALAPGTFTLIQSSSTINGLANFHLGTVQPGVYASLVTTATSVSLNITNVVNALEWTGNTDNNWDTSTINWRDLSSGNPTNFSQTAVGDGVVFDSFVTYMDVNLTTTVKPVAMTVNGATSYSFAGPGKISGVASLLVDGFASATFGTANDYSGGTLLNAGNIYAGADGALGSGPVTININGVLASDSAAARTLTNTFIQTSDTGVTFGESGKGPLALGKLDLNGSSTRSLSFYSSIILSGGITNGAFTSKTGTGSLTLKGDSAQAALVNHQEGDFIVDGARFDNGNGWRVASDIAGATVRLIVTNGGMFTITATSANLRVGQSGIGGDNGAGTTNLLDVSGTVNLTPSGTLGANSAVALGLSGGSCIFNLRPGGNVMARAVTGGSPAVTEAHFYGGKLTAIGDEPAFVAGLTNAFMENGGLTIDTTNYSVTVPQALIASGSGGLTKEGAGTLTLTGTNTYTGATVVNGGKLVLGEAHMAPGGNTVNANAILAFLQTTPTNSVRVSGVTIGDGANSALEAELAATNFPAGVITNLVLNGPATVNVTGPVRVGQFPLLGYGTISGPGSLSVGVLPQGDTGHLVTNTLNKTIDLVVDSVALVKWTGAASGNWDTTTTNWTLAGVPAVYQQYASVVFDDSASNSAVNLTATLTPSSINVSNNAFGYTLFGSGSLDGGLTITKNGTNTLALNTANTFIGSVNIKGGVVTLGNATALGSAANTVFSTNGGTLDINGQALGAQPLTASGSGLSGAGAIVNNGADQVNAFINLTLAGNTSIGGSSQIGIRTGADTDVGLNANGYHLTKVGSDTVNLNGGKTTAGLTNVWNTNIGDIDIQQGTLSFERRSALGNPTNTITVESGATLSLFSLNQDLAVPANHVVLNGGTLQGTGAIGDTNTFGGQVALNGSSNAISVSQWVGTTGPTLLYLNGPIVGSGSVTYTTLTNGGVNGVIRLAGNNTYNGNTVVANGTLMLASGSALGGTPGIMLNSNATLDVTTIAPWTLGVGQTLGGSGTVAGDVLASGTLAPGSSIGTLTVNGNLTVNGQLAIEVNKALAQSNDVIAVSGSLNNTSSGTLTVSNLNSLAPLAAGDKFTLFTEPVLNGNTLNVVGAGVTWINNLAFDGSIQVNTVASNPQIGKVAASGGNLTMTGSGGSPDGTYYVITATNVATPALNWVPVSTNTFASDGNFTNTLSIAPGEAKRFYRLKTP